MLTLNKHGDTIIEVMIALAVTSLVLGASYSSANSSLKIGRDAEERGQANKFASSQIELIKHRIETGNTDVLTTDTFCMNQDGSGPIKDPGFVAPPSDPNTDDFSLYPAGCIVGLYNLAVTPTAEANNVYQYRVTARWESILSGRNEVMFYYRLPGS